MTFGRILIVLFMTVNLFLVAKKEVEKDESLTIKRVLKFVLSPVLFPYALFVFGYIYFYPEFYTFASWSPSPGLISNFFMLVLFSTAFNLVIVYYFPEDSINVTNNEDIRKIATSQNRTRLAIVTSASASLKASFTEEILYRFQGLFVTLTVIGLFEYFFPNTVTSFASLLPSWLTLGVANQIPALAFAGLFITNALFAVIHLLDAYGKWKFVWLHRVLLAWFYGWVFVIALIQFGFVGAFVVHFLLDFVLLTPVFIIRFNQIAKEYWDEKYGPI